MRARGLVLPLALLLLWEGAARGGAIHSDLMTKPSDVLVAGLAALADGSLLRATLETGTTVIAGLALGASLGVLLGMIFGLFRPSADLAKLSLELLRPIPSVALIPIAMLVFGFGFAMQIAIVAFACFWPPLIVTQAAVSGIDRPLLQVSRVLELGFVERLRKIVLPAILPRLFTGLRLAAGIALVVAVTVEITANPLGLGYGLIIAEQNMHPDLMFAFLIWVGLLGWGLNAALLWGQDHLFRRWTMA